VLFRSVLEALNGTLLVTGKVTDVARRTATGFARGEATVDGTIGLRVVRTDEHLVGFLPTATTPQELDYTNGYTDWLPNANMRIRFSSEWQLRLAATRTRTRPTFQQLRPSIALDGPPGCPVGQPGCQRNGNSGNPLLEPLTSNNYDASLEYYFSPTGFASVAAFRRDMRGFVANTQTQFPSPDPGTGLPLFISSPVNTNRGRIQGFEAQVSTFFDFGGVPDWLRRFGVQANVTYIDAKADYAILCDPVVAACTPTPAFPNATIVRLRIPDVSKWTYNLVGMYEGGGLTLRLAYNTRSGYPEGALSERDRFYTLQGHGHSVSRLDWSSSYAINEHLTVFFDWTNILSKPFRSDIVRVNYGPAGAVTGTEQFPMIVRYDESVMTGGVRFRF